MWARETAMVKALNARSKRYRSLAVAASLVFVFGSGFPPAPACGSSATLTRVVSPVASDAKGASCVVTGYTLHADDMMVERHITTDQVEALVHGGCTRARKQKNGRYLYTNGKITVVAEPSGYVVTVWRN